LLEEEHADSLWTEPMIGFYFLVLYSFFLLLALPHVCIKNFMCKHFGSFDYVEIESVIDVDEGNESKIEIDIDENENDGNDEESEINVDENENDGNDEESESNGNVIIGNDERSKNDRNVIIGIQNDNNEI
ncbi:hypothetical protein RclHR1_39650001, partial [Rhizophagus clarus]